MECLVVGAVIVALALWPLARMLLGKGPSSLGRLTRPDLAAFFVLTAGIAGALGVTRAVIRTEGKLIAALVFCLSIPMAIAAAWFTRFLIEELAFHFGKPRRRWNRTLPLNTEWKNDLPDTKREDGQSGNS